MRDIYQEVTDKIVAALDQGTVPWIKPWSATGSPNGNQQPYPINAVTKRPYSGINLPLLWAEARLQGFSQDRWLTFNQARKAGGHIRKGERSSLAVLYKPMERDAQDAAGNALLDDNGDIKRVHFALLKAHHLFNIEQTQGLEALVEEPTVADPEKSFVSNSGAEHLLLSSGARLLHKATNLAFYYPPKDFIQLPTKAQFHDEGAYYATALHELTHWSGHGSRLCRAGVTSAHLFGSPDYAFEELIAEMGAAFLCAAVGIKGELRHESYLDTWLSLLKADKRAIFRASGQAREASEYLLGLARAADEGVEDQANSAEQNRPLAVEM
jgi:antirestriction protein ArdC